MKKVKAKEQFEINLSDDSEESSECEESESAEEESKE